MTTEAKEFLSHFEGLQIFVACDERQKNKPWHFHCSFEKALPKLNERQEFNWGAYFTVNELDKSLDPERKRTKKMVKRIRAVFCEYDNKTDFPDFPIKPSISVETSPGKYHFYWLTTTDNIEQWTGVQQCIVNDYGGDKNAKDITRYLRIPGFNHCKVEPRPVKLIDANGKRYSWETICIAFPPTAERKNSDRSQNQETPESSTIKNHDLDIIHGRHFHSPVIAHMQRIKDGDPPHLIKSHLKNMFELAKANESEWVRTETEWQAAYNTIDYQVDEYVKELSIAKPVSVAAAKQNSIPKFPKDFIKDWPDPWPMIWENYKKIPRTLDECLLLPTVLTVHAFALNATYINEWGKRPNLAFLNIAPSTGNKDVNSEDVLRTMLDILAKKEKVNIPFAKMVAGAEGITSDTAFLQSFQDGDLFWVNTEATYLFQQMAQAGNTNSSVKAIESKIIDVVDGGPIRGKRKAGKDGNITGIDDPNAQILLYAQPETISAYLKGNMVDSGLLGRMIIHIPENDELDPFLDSFKRREDFNLDIDEDLVKLYSNFSARVSNKIVIRPTEEGIENLQKWMMDTIKPMANGDHSIKMLKRLAISAEQLYTVILGICKQWDKLSGVDSRNEFDVSCMFRILEYWAECKMYVLNEFIDNSIDPLADAILDIIRDLISGKIKIQTKKGHYGAQFKNHFIARHEVWKVVSNRVKLRRELDARGDAKNVRERVNRIIGIFINDGTLIENDSNNVIFLGFREND